MKSDYFKHLHLKSHLLVGIIFCSISVSAQRSRVVAEVEQKGIVYYDEWSVGGRLLTNGWEVFGERAKIKSIHKTRIIQFGISEIKNWKETRQPAEFTFLGPFLDSPKNFYFGKQNHFFTLRAGYGYRKNIADKAEKNGVRFAITYLGGISLGIVKPYYLNIAYPLQDNSPGQTYVILSQRYTEQNHDKFLDWFSIAGASGFKYGLSEIEPLPGIYGKLGLNFDWAGKEEFVKALEAGIMLDLYYKRVPISISDDNRFLFVAAYVSFQFGKRW